MFSREEGTGGEKETVDMEKDTLHTGKWNRLFLKNGGVGNARFPDIASIHLVVKYEL